MIVDSEFCDAYNNCYGHALHLEQQYLWPDSPVCSICVLARVQQHKSVDKNLHQPFRWQTSTYSPQGTALTQTSLASFITGILIRSLKQITATIGKLA